MLLGCWFLLPLPFNIKYIVVLAWLLVYLALQYRHLIPSTVDRTSASTWLYKHPWITCRKNKPSTSMTHVACESKLRHPCTGNWAIKRAVVYYAGLPTHLAQELNSGTVEFIPNQSLPLLIRSSKSSPSTQISPNVTMINHARDVIMQTKLCRNVHSIKHTAVTLFNIPLSSLLIYFRAL